MTARLHFLVLQAPPAEVAAAFARWLRTHRGALGLAGLLAFATPAMLFAGALSVARGPAAQTIAALALWFMAYGLALWALLVVVGFALQRLQPGSRLGRAAATLIGACAVTAGGSLIASGRAELLLEVRVIASEWSMHLNAFALSLVMPLLYFAHLRRSQAHEAAVARLAVAQAAQRESRRRLVQSRLSALQARVDPQMLFDLLDAVRRAHEDDAERAECLLDELIAFLRAALPRLHSASSSVAREAELARAYARLRALAADERATELALSIDAGALHARCPPGLLLPLLDDVLREHGGRCALAARCGEGRCRIALALPRRPAPAALERVRGLLDELYAGAARLALDAGADDGSIRLTLTLPHEPA